MHLFIYLFVDYLTTLLSDRLYSVGWKDDKWNKLESMWKEAVVAWFKILYRQLPGGTEKNTNTSGGIARIRAEIWTWDLQNTKQEC
jgi:hypothetical protein